MAGMAGSRRTTFQTLVSLRGEAHFLAYTLNVVCVRFRATEWRVVGGTPGQDEENRSKPMIHGLEVQNYKCFCDRTYVPLAPITVLVGQNSSGKSTILQLIAGLKQTLADRGATDCALFPQLKQGGLVDLGALERIFFLGRANEGLWLGFHMNQPDVQGLLGWRARFGLSQRGGIQVLVALRHEFYEVESGEAILAFDLDDPPEDAGEMATDWDNNVGPFFERAVQMKLPFFNEKIQFLLDKLGVPPAECRAVLHKNFLPPTVYYTRSLDLGLPERHTDEQPLPFHVNAVHEVLEYFNRVDYYPPFRGAPARETIVDSIEQGGGSWEDGTIALRELAQDEDLRRDVNAWLSLLTDHSLVCEPIPGRGVTVKIRDDRMGDDIALDLADVGYGITHLLPIVTMLMAGKERVALISQPETHVHPSLQAELGELLVHAWELRKMQCVVETHSEHLIRRLQRRVRGGRLKPEDVAILYVDRTPDGSTVTRLRMDSSGDFIDNWPRGFFPEWLNETLGD